MMIRRTTATALAFAACGVLVLGIAQPIRAGTYRHVASFAGGAYGPRAGVIAVRGKLYGTTAGGGGALYSLDPKTGIIVGLHGFTGGADGSLPEADMINVGGALYGTTSAGGGSENCLGGCGTVFSFGLKTNMETVVHSFFDLSFDDGYSPQAGLIDVGGVLYGTTLYGGAYGSGTVFSLDPSTGAETVVYSFKGGNDGGMPAAALIKSGAVLYGTTSSGGFENCSTNGPPGCGTVFSLDLKTGIETVLYSFRGGSDGATPDSSLVKVGDRVYGTTYQGGGGSCSNLSAIGCGTVFSLSLATGAEHVLHSFRGGSDGALPQAPLIDANGTLYGTTSYGGGSTQCAGGCGVLFSIDMKFGALRLVHSFDGAPSDGAYSVSGLIDVSGTLYGTTTGGGSSDLGTVFSYVP